MDGSLNITPLTTFQKQKRDAGSGQRSPMNRPLKTGRFKTCQHFLNREEFGVELEKDVGDQLLPFADVQE